MAEILVQAKFAAPLDQAELAGETVTVEPGDEVFIPKGALHSLRNVHHATSVWLYGYD